MRDEINAANLVFFFSSPDKRTKKKKEEGESRVCDMCGLVE
jgi:hypothetical protein